MSEHMVHAWAHVSTLNRNQFTLFTLKLCSHRGSCGWGSGNVLFIQLWIHGHKTDISWNPMGESKRKFWLEFSFLFYELLNIVNTDTIRACFQCLSLWSQNPLRKCFRLVPAPWCMHYLITRDLNFSDSNCVHKSSPALYLNKHARSFAVSRANFDLLSIWFVMSQMSENGDMLSDKRAFFGHKISCSKIRRLMDRGAWRALHTLGKKKLAANLSISS